MNIYEIIGSILAAFVVGLFYRLYPKAKAWFEATTSKADQEKVRQLVRSFARAAEQLFHDMDKDGKYRNNYVQDQLSALGIKITAAILNMIEAEVWEINTENKKAQVQDKAIAAGGAGNGNG